MISVDKNLCPQNHKCPAIRICPVQAISQIAHELPVIDNSICISCEKCIYYCPMGAIINN